MIRDKRSLLKIVQRSMADLQRHRRKPVRIRIHPDDWETIIGGSMKLYGVEVVLDEEARRGSPVAEWDPFQ